ncbi:MULTISPECIES: site-specific integrase [Bacillus]|uniref:YdcL (Lambda integrase-like, N-terminal,DNA breaking-rejoining enzyme, catalytic core) n=1 Tax=Bacillus thuringiensis YBT-1518 TaxID=529122 RepID=A0A9W3KH25_BACTU|nr:site-specific integrase [Bacillus thuringiensis]EKS8368967.1 site-specific integrase [Bacillus cereus]AHA74591.1 YdcL (Lambda integrase-like, N-terminal,DNA breaking-rejoining enzyme, catalytic core) [Bacillus thuringiensis YBT-1518]MBG9486679.1 integrase [Bacillus thuringiensis]MBG9497556.1 integrase [Bacillus thuringiensis]MED3387575.1 site-specific integrase [Bacillus thuringiensis]
MVVYKDKERGTYFFVVRVRQFDGTQKQVKRRGFKTKKEAREAEAKMLIEKETNSSLTFAQVADSYFNWYSQRRKQSSINTIKNAIYNHLLKEFGKVKIDCITARHVMDYQNKMINEYSAEYLKKFHTTLSAIFNFGIKFHGLTTNPARIAGNFQKESKKRINFWEFEEFKQFISFVDEPLYKAFFSTLYYSGARKGELLALTWADVNFEERTIDINKTEYNRQITVPKTKSSNRIIMLPNFVMHFLQTIKEDAALTVPVKNDYVVFGEFYTSLATTSLHKKFNKYLKISMVKEIVMHEFRHSHASYLINKGVSPLVVAQRLGHSDVATTLNTYSHLYPSKQAEVVAFMENDLV